ncbi:SGNH/GDSL hydrolase family protein [Microbacterium halophytorum]|uniref:SGNH/GDSL hydrolase family protein n=1 Tax=Microbacterium halophytorum TaxID=2067568 RepID=UPI000CFA8F53|nr:SGNH/GDSL hydrolase family protein [Microbacterium halophytorum]
MGRVRTVAGVALAAACAASAVWGARELLRRQAAIARERIGKPLGEESIPADRIWRRKLGGEPVELLVLGDSLAAGLGAERRKQTLGARLAKELARRMDRPVRLHTAAVVGSESSALKAQIDGLDPALRADVAVIVVGGNDVTHTVYPTTAAAQLSEAIRRLRERGTPVVVGTCPDLGMLPAVPQPLRTILSRMSHHMSIVQARAARRAGAVPVSLRRTLSRAFREAPDEMFSLDRFHPSPAGYRRAADALLPAVAEAALVGAA